MSGVSVTVDLAGDRRIASTFARLAYAVGPRGALLKAIGVVLVSGVHDRFDAGAGPDGARWTPLNPTYAAVKRGRKILQGSGMRGGLMSSVTYRVAGDAVEVGSNRVYARIHQLGGTITPKGGGRLAFNLGNRTVFAKSVTIPARPYLGVSNADADAILDAVEAAVRRAIGG